jgi:uncharacterized damage-inducible protein DinB
VTDAVLAAGRELVAESLSDLRSTIEGLSLDALNWRPGGEETNSIAVLTTHALHSTRMWLSIAMGTPLPERDRDSEFRASADDTGALLRMVDEFSESCIAILSSAEEADWSAMRQRRGRGGQAAPEVPAAYALIQASTHLRGHVDQIGLTRWMWKEQATGSTNP